jgi:hypothetical protein
MVAAAIAAAVIAPAPSRSFAFMVSPSSFEWTRCAVPMCDALKSRALPPLVLCLSLHLLKLFRSALWIWAVDLGCGSVSSFETAVHGWSLEVLRMVTWPFRQKGIKNSRFGDLRFPWKEQIGQMVTWPELYRIKVAFVKPPRDEPRPDSRRKFQVSSEQSRSGLILKCNLEMEHWFKRVTLEVSTLRLSLDFVPGWNHKSSGI